MKRIIAIITLIVTAHIANAQNLIIGAMKFKSASVKITKFSTSLAGADTTSDAALPTAKAVNDRIRALQGVLVLKGTVNWTPGVVAAGSSATTTVTVTGAALGDPVTISKASGAYSNGELYDAFVSATNTVTIRVHNVSTGSANYSSAADYNVIVLKY